jgi:hypothetical protein
MSVRKTIANKAFGGRNVFRRAPYPHIQVLASGTANSTQIGVITYSVATTGCYIAVNTAGTGTKFNV